MDLMCVATLEEAEDIVKGIQKNKSPALDGFITEFYQATLKFMG